MLWSWNRFLNNGSFFSIKMSELDNLMDSEDPLVWVVEVTPTTLVQMVEEGHFEKGISADKKVRTYDFLKRVIKYTIKKRYPAIDELTERIIDRELNSAFLGILTPPEFKARFGKPEHVYSAEDDDLSNAGEYDLDIMDYYLRVLGELSFAAIDAIKIRYSGDSKNMESFFHAHLRNLINLVDKFDFLYMYLPEGTSTDIIGKLHGLYEHTRSVYDTALERAAN